MESKPYLVLARKYRPRTFDEVVGQEHLSTTLKNAIELGRIAHAYLFCGPRGVGKTSMARIFAKALNCKSGPTATPCGKCQACLEIEGARSLDVLEIDGASNRGIDEIRALRENVKFAPALGKYKIYIIDEVHQVTSEGFNALLKTLEEPPAHVKFIFATTAAHKVPATILSRCQRFDFRRIPVQKIVELLKEICSKEKIRIDDEALFLIAKASDGGMRDAESILDQAASVAGGTLSKADLVGTLGWLEEEDLTELVDAVAGKDARTALLVLDRVLAKGKDPAIFIERLLEHVRHLLLLAVSEDLADTLEVSESYRKALLAQKGRFSKDDLFYFFSVLLQTHQTLKRFESKRIVLEIAVVKLAGSVPVRDLAAMIEKLSEAEKKTTVAERRPVTPAVEPPPAPNRPNAASAAPAAAAAASPRAAPAGLGFAPEPDEEKEQEELPPAEADYDPMTQAAQSSRSLESIWEPLLKQLRTEKISVATYLEEASPMALSNGVARISFPEKLSFHRESLERDENRKLIERHLATLLDFSVRVEFMAVKSEDGAEEPQPRAGGLSNPEVQDAMKNAMNVLGGRVIRG